MMKGSKKGAIVVNTERCKGCGLCEAACPLHLIYMSPRAVNRKGYPYAMQREGDACNGCASCAIVCPDACISVYQTQEK